MWRAVKFENFIFSFQNTLVAHAYDSLCKEFSDWEWSFKRHIYSWLESATIQISNAETSSLQEVEEIVEALNGDAQKEIASQKREMDEKLKTYYKRKDRHHHSTDSESLQSSQQSHLHPKDTVDRVLFQNTGLCTPFTKNLLEYLKDLKKQLEEEIKSSDITETLNSVSVKPQNELFKRIFGCGKQCPFCKAPCEAGGKDHRQHHAAVHRPKGLGRYRYVSTNILCEEICTSSVHGNGSFKNHETDFQPHPYKDYHTYYPNWLIPPDRTIEASDYWKYVLVKYNDKFAEEYIAKPAVYPSVWNNIDKVQALEGLKSAFCIK
ncbi:interferon-induced very large GTPase 1-like [Pygocentrus nattereri]|uniref:interferon-induced very large GTPase 1-like n=1 Tax=Pygocentrus nattereri TaxID=42514 RepID=UPI0018911393|nr:interferon-induced very large GTPase 1-like [Pygocentrus nattereri]